MRIETFIHKIWKEEINSETYAKWEDNIKIDLKETVCEWVKLILWIKAEATTGFL
jgi:hypothetical protein